MKNVLHGNYVTLTHTYNNLLLHLIRSWQTGRTFTFDLWMILTFHSNYTQLATFLLNPYKSALSIQYSSFYITLVGLAKRKHLPAQQGFNHRVTALCMSHDERSYLPPPCENESHRRVTIMIKKTNAWQCKMIMQLLQINHVSVTNGGCTLGIHLEVF